jgi:predicted nucleic acid-binding protein
MKAYWDSSALIKAALDLTLRKRLSRERAFTRRHALAEIFSSLSGKPHFRLTIDDAAAMLATLEVDLDTTEEFTNAELLEAARSAKKLGVKGGRFYDLLHALAAKKAGATEVLTVNKNDFDGLVPGQTITLV